MKKYLPAMSIELAVALGFVLFGVFVLIVMPYQITERMDVSKGAFSPSFFPRLVAVLLLGCSVLLLLGIFTRKRSVEHSPPPSTSESEQNKRGMKDFVVLGLLFSYALLFDVLGFVISTLIHLVLLFICFDMKNWKVAGSVAILFTLAIFLLFNVAFSIPLPRLTAFF